MSKFRFCSIPQNLKFIKYSKRFSYTKKLRFERCGMHRIRWGGCCGLVVLEHGRLNIKQLQTVLVIINKTIKQFKKEEVFFNCSVSIRAPITKKPLGSRMGRGKGVVDDWVVPLLTGRVLFPFFSKKVANFEQIVDMLNCVRYKLPFLTKVIAEPFGGRF